MIGVALRILHSQKLSNTRPQESRPLPRVGLMVSIPPQNRIIRRIPLLGHVWFLREGFFVARISQASRVSFGVSARLNHQDPARR